jgi:dUTP pyrophosphatase
MTSIFISLAPEDGDLMPRRQHESDAAYDLRSRVDMTIEPGCFAGVPTGVRLEMPADFVADVRPRSGLAFKHGITVLNSPGTIDSGYRGEVQAILINHGKEPFVIRRGDRIAQMLFQRLPQVELIQRDELSESDRGEGGFGSTGRS